MEGLGVVVWWCLVATPTMNVLLRIVDSVLVEEVFKMARRLLLTRHPSRKIRGQEDN